MNTTLSSDSARALIEPLPSPPYVEVDSSAHLYRRADYEYRQEDMHLFPFTLPYWVLLLGATVRYRKSLHRSVTLTRTFTRNVPPITGPLGQTVQRTAGEEFRSQTVDRTLDQSRTTGTATRHRFNPKNEVSYHCPGCTSLFSENSHFIEAGKFVCHE